jgi:hypothetical protein
MISRIFTRRFDISTESPLPPSPFRSPLVIRGGSLCIIETRLASLGLARGAIRAIIVRCRRHRLALAIEKLNEM